MQTENDYDKEVHDGDLGIVSRIDLRARASQQQLRADFETYLDGFSPNVNEILESFEFRNQIPRLSRADALGSLIEKFLDPSINLSPAPVKNANGAVRLPGLDNHAMGTIFEELVRRFNEGNTSKKGPSPVHPPSACSGVKALRKHKQR